jgi:hypothetical protein
MAAEEPKVQIDSAGTVEFQTAQLAPALNTIITESKKGYKTTEFWVSIVVGLLTVLDGIPLPEKFEGVVVGAIGLAYVLSRGFAKQGVPAVVVEEVPPAPVPPVPGDGVLRG